MLEPGKPKLLLSTQEGPILGDEDSSKESFSGQRRSHLVWVETGSQPVEGNLEG